MRSFLYKLPFPRVPEGEVESDTWSTGIYRWVLDVLFLNVGKIHEDNNAHKKVSLTVEGIHRGSYMVSGELPSLTKKIKIERVLIVTYTVHLPKVIET